MANETTTNGNAGSYVNYEANKAFQDGNVLYASGLWALEDALNNRLNIAEPGPRVAGDLNNYKVPGVYSIFASSDALNLPKVDLPNGTSLALERGGKLIVLTHYNETRRLQIVSEAGTDNKIFYRVFEELSTAPGTGSWQPWQLIVRNLGDLGITSSLKELNNISVLEEDIKNIKNGTTSVGVAERVKGTLTIGDTEYNGNGNVEITAADLGLDTAIKFIGVIDAKDDLPASANNGDVVLWKEKEYIYSKGEWVLFGDEGSYALKSIVIGTPMGSGLTGGGDLTQSRALQHAESTFASFDIPPGKAVTGLKIDRFGHLNGYSTNKDDIRERGLSIKATGKNPKLSLDAGEGKAANTISFVGNGFTRVSADNSQISISTNIKATGANDMDQVATKENPMYISTSEDLEKGELTIYFHRLKGEKGDPGDPLSGIVPIANGGTNATDAATARKNLGITLANLGAAAASHTHTDYLNIDAAGSTIAKNTDLNTIITPGHYSCVRDNNSGLSNCPVSSGGFKLIVIRGYSSDYFSQFIMVGANNKYYYRSRNSSGTWTAWVNFTDKTPAAHTHDALSGWADTRDAKTTPNDYNGFFRVVGIKTPTASGITSDNGGSYSTLVGIRGWSDNSGGNAHELAFCGNGALYHRHGATTSWGSWAKIYTSANKPTLSELGAASASHNHDSAYYGVSVSRRANTVLAGPNGSSGNATFRKLDAADIPNLSASKITSGTLPIARGGTGATDAAHARSALGTACSYNVGNSPAGYDGIAYGWVLTNYHASPTSANGWGDGYYMAVDSTGVLRLGRQLNQATSITWSKVYGENNKPTPDAIGAAKASHGTHVTSTNSTQWNAAYTHSTSAHAPSNAQKNSDITKAEIEAKLTGTITSHSHNYAASSHSHSASEITSGTLSIARGGTGATTAAAALTSLGAAAASHNHDAGNITTGTIAAARLPTASSSAFGVVKIGSNISVSSGTISLTKANVTTALGYTPPTTDTKYTLPAAGATTLGGVYLYYGSSAPSSKTTGTIWLKGTGTYA